MSEREQDVRDPAPQGPGYEAQAGSSAPAAPARERPSDVRQAADPQRDDAQAIEERAATTKTQPMARFEGGKHESRQAVRQGSLQEARSEALVQDQRWQSFVGRWDAIQSGFVDDPRRTVEQADRLVAEVIDHLSKMFMEERAKLEAQWSRGGKVETEDLRVAMQRYRDFFRMLVGR